MTGPKHDPSLTTEENLRHDLVDEIYDLKRQLKSERRIAQAARDFNTLPTSVTAMHLRRTIEEEDFVQMGMRVVGNVLADLDADIRAKAEREAPAP
jgi:hypothetical protein